MPLSSEVKQAVIDFIDHYNEPITKASTIKELGSLRVTIIKHTTTGRFLPKIRNRTERVSVMVHNFLNGPATPKELLDCFKIDTNISLFDIEAIDRNDAWDICAWICETYRDSEKLLTPKDNNFFFRRLPLELQDIIDGAVAGDGFITQHSAVSGTFGLTLGEKQAGHAEEYREELAKFGYSGKIKQVTYYTRQINSKEKTFVTTVRLSWTLWCFLDHRRRWYSGKQKILPLDVRNTSAFWRWFYAGDGTLYVINPFCYRVLIAANDFLTQDVDRLIAMLKDHGIKSTRYLKRYTEKTGNPQWTIAINKRKDVDRFLKLIGPPVRSIEYKWERPPVPPKDCLGCGKTYIPTRGDNDYCTVKCLRKQIDARHYAKIKSKRHT